MSLSRRSTLASVPGILVAGLLVACQGGEAGRAEDSPPRLLLSATTDATGSLFDGHAPSWFAELADEGEARNASPSRAEPASDWPRTEEIVLTSAQQNAAATSADWPSDMQFESTAMQAATAVAQYEQYGAADYAPPGFAPRPYQDAPGIPEYEELSQDLPLVYDQPYYYYNDDIPGARPMADYAPPGYMPREQQEGPGAPEFTPLGPPVRVTPEDRDKFVVRGIYPGSFLVPGINTSFRFRGFVRLAALYDFDPIGSADSFVTNTIRVPQQAGQNFNMSGRISRFGLETWTPTSFCDWNVHTFIEMDFFNGAAQAAGGGGNPLRLRHAFIDFGYFRFGQQNSVFMDGTNWPSLVDFQGPNSWVNQRQPSVRMTIPLGERLFWATSVERPFSDITTSGLGAAVQDVPDFATHLRFEGDRGHLQVSGLLRTIGYRPTGEDVTRQSGAAISGSAVFHPWALVMGTDPVRGDDPSGLTRSRILLMCTGGRGLGRYMNDLAGQGLDGQVNPLTGSFDLVDSFGWNASYEHWFSANWLANFTYAHVNVDNTPGQLGATYDSAKYLAASLWWIPITRLSFGVELISGERENLNGLAADADRLHGLVQYNF